MTGEAYDLPVVDEVVPPPIEERAICRLDTFGAWTGEWVTQPVTEGAPEGWIWADPPLPASDEVARWSAGHWEFDVRDDAAAARAAFSARQSALLVSVNDRRDAILSAGFSPAAGPLAGHTLQTRDADDKVNWKLSRDAYKEAIEAGYGDAPQATFRTSGNRTITVTIREGFAVLEAMQAWGVAVLGRSWTLKDAVAAASDADLDVIDITTGWPT